MRAIYTSRGPVIGAELSVLMRTNPPTLARSFVSRRLDQLRSSMLAKIGVGAAVVVAATSGLAAAGALPAPVKDAVSHLGITTPSHHNSDTPAPRHPTTTTMANPAANHLGDGSGAMHEPSSDRCAASTLRANDALDGSCETTTTIADGLMPPTVVDGGGDSVNRTPPTTIEPNPTPTTANDGGGDTGNGTSPTTTEPDTTPTTIDNSAAAPNSSDGGATVPSGSNTTVSTPGGDN